MEERVVFVSVDWVRDICNIVVVIVHSARSAGGVHILEEIRSDPLCTSTILTSTLQSLVAYAMCRFPSGKMVPL